MNLFVKIWIILQVGRRVSCFNASYSTRPEKKIILPMGDAVVPHQSDDFW